MFDLDDLFGPFLDTRIGRWLLYAAVGAGGVVCISLGLGIGADNGFSAGKLIAGVLLIGIAALMAYFFERDARKMSCLGAMAALAAIVVGGLIVTALLVFTGRE